MGRVIITEEGLDQSIFQFGPSEEGVKEKKIETDTEKERSTLIYINLELNHTYG